MKQKRDVRKDVLFFVNMRQISGLQSGWVSCNIRRLLREGDRNYAVFV